MHAGGYDSTELDQTEPVLAATSETESHKL